MKKQIRFETDKDLIIFKDSNSDHNFYCMTPEVLQEKMKITAQYGKKEADVPDGVTIKVSPFIKTGQDFNSETYMPDMNTELDFPVNRIEWMWIRIERMG